MLLKYSNSSYKGRFWTKANYVDWTWRAKSVNTRDPKKTIMHEFELNITFLGIFFNATQGY